MTTELLGMVLVPIAIGGLGFLFLFLARDHENHVQDRGCKEFLRLYPKMEYCPQDCSFWAIQAVERERKERKKLKEKKKNEKNSEKN